MKSSVAILCLVISAESFWGPKDEPRLYYTPGSPPCRLVQLVAAALEVKLNLTVVSLRDGEHLDQNYSAVNPQRTIPTYVETNGFTLRESRAISRYLINKSGGWFYPNNYETRGLVDQWLDFDIGTLSPAFVNYYYPILFNGTEPNMSLQQKVQENLQFLNTNLKDNKYATGKELTIADLGLLVTVSSIDVAGISLKPFTYIERWLQVMVNSSATGHQKGKYLSVYEKGIADFKKVTEQLKLENQKKRT